MAAVDRPHYVRDDLLGLDAWRALVGRYGGCGYKIPATIASDRGRALAALIGERAAQQLIEYGGGCEIYVHAARDEISTARHREIRAMRARGMTIVEIVRAYTWTACYTERAVYEILAAEGEGELVQAYPEGPVPK